MLFAPNNVLFPRNTFSRLLILLCFLTTKSSSGQTYTNFPAEQTGESPGKFTINSRKLQQPSRGDVIINEVFPDPSPAVGLPGSEFVEIHNTLAIPVYLKGWKLSDGTSTATLPGKTIAPKGYLIICTTGDTVSYRKFGPVCGVSSFPSLNNSGDKLTLYSDSLKIIDQLNYSDTWYKEASKKEGGWTLERIDPRKGICFTEGNWSASKAPAGGTPGRQNSIYGTYSDTTSPTLMKALVRSDTLIELGFSEQLDSSEARRTVNYTMSPGIGNPAKVSISGTSILLGLSTAMQPSVVYTVKTGASLQDCSGNPVNAGSTRVGIAQAAEENDIVINEILFNPKPYGSDFVELYNRSGKILELRELRWANKNFPRDSAATKAVSDSSRLLFPGDYAAFTPDPDNILRTYPCPKPAGIIKSTLPALDDKQSSLFLLNRKGSPIDRLDYTESMHFFLLADREGVSLERLSPNRPSRDTTNWHSASETSGFATPGYQNSQYSSTETNTPGPFSLESEIFSPDNDGYRDNLTIDYRFDRPGALASISIYGDNGFLVKKLYNNELLGSSGSVSWNGLYDTGEKARIGIYILLFETIDSSGTMMSYKKSCVLAGRID